MTAPARGRAHVNQVLRGYRTTQLLYVVAKLGVADRLVDGPRSARALAELVGAHPEALFRVLRALAHDGIFHRDEDRFSLNEAAQALRTDVPMSLRPAAMLYGEPWWWGAWGGLLETVRTGRTAFDDVHGAGLFAYLGDHPEASASFNAAMQQMTGERAAAIAAGYEFSSTTRLVDVGGGHGALAAAILERHPGVEVTVFDSAEVVAGALTRLAQLGFANRTRVAGGSFFESVPSGGDTYTLKDILHDWDDARALQILRNVRRATADGARVLVIERLVPEGDEASASTLVDISMLVLTGGKERTLAEYGSLLRRSGFDVQGVVRIDDETSVVEAMPSREPPDASGAR